jgi:hypothetical protein
MPDVVDEQSTRLPGGMTLKEIADPHDEFRRGLG